MGATGSRQIPNVEPTRLTVVLCVGGEGKRGVQEESWLFCPNNRVKGPLTEVGNLPDK